MINNLHDAMKERKGKEVLGPIIDDMIEYTITHFTREEKLFAQHGYAEGVRHAGVHKALTQQVLDLKTKLDNGTGVLPVEVMSFMKTWLTSHIMAEDRKYAPFLKSKGMA